MKKIKKIKIDNEIFYDPEKSGVFSFISRDPDFIRRFTNKKDVCIKVFFKSVNGSLNNYNWGYDFPVKNKNGAIRYEYSNILDSLRIQNLCAREGLAPRIYDLVLIEYQKCLYPAIVVEDMGDSVEKNEEIINEVFQKIIKVGKKYKFYPRFLDPKEGNIINGKLVDFQSWVFENIYFESMKDRYKRLVTWSGNTYQDVEGIFNQGYRSSERNKLIEFMNKDFDFQNRSVHDIGCSGAYFSRLASRKGADVMAIDLPDVIKGAFEVSNYLLYFDIDFKSEVLARNDDTDIDPDIVFFFSMQMHVGLPEFLFKANNIFYEHNGYELQEDIIKIFKNKNYKIVKDFGITGKLDNRKTYLLSKIK